MNLSFALCYHFVNSTFCSRIAANVLYFLYVQYSSTGTMVCYKSYHKNICVVAERGRIKAFFETHFKLVRAFFFVRTCTVQQYP